MKIRKQISVLLMTRGLPFGGVIRTHRATRQISKPNIERTQIKQARLCNIPVISDYLSAKSDAYDVYIYIYIYISTYIYIYI